MNPEPVQSVNGRGVAFCGGIVTIALVVVALLGAAHAQAQEDFGIEVVDGSVSDAAGDAYTQAGGHPYEATVAFDLETRTDDDGNMDPGGTLRDVNVDLPAGLVGNVTSLPTCSSARRLLPEEVTPENMCPPSTIVGSTVVRTAVEPFAAAVFNIEPPPGVAARFGFNIGIIPVPVILDATVRTDDEYGISIASIGTSQSLTPVGVTTTLWGNPADSSHDDERCLYQLAALPMPTCPGGPPFLSPSSYPAGFPEVPLITNPTRCTEPGEGLETGLRVASYEGDTDTASFESHRPPHYPAPPQDWGEPVGPTGCEDVPFEPQIDVEALNDRADQPTGLTVGLSMPQDGLLSPDGLASAHLKRAEVTLPEGMAISASAADGLASCSPDQIGLESSDPIRFNDADPACPDASKIGTLEIETPLLDEDLAGEAYIAEQGDNPFDSTFAIYLVAQEQGVTVKLPGLVSPDPDTGQITATFDDNPELPFSALELRLAGGSRAPLVNPPICGEKSVEAEFTPWSAADPDDPTSSEVRSRTDTFEINQGPGGGSCASSPGELGFDPELSAGTANPAAGSFSPFSLRLTRDDGERSLRELTVELPEGLSGRLAGIPYCSEEALSSLEGSPNTAPGTAQAEIDDPSCPEASRVGRVTVGSGAGSSPFYLDTGRAYLAGPYRGAPLSLAIVNPVKAGPFDLGNVLVRSAIEVDDRTARLTVRSDEIPTILEGVPLNIRDLRVVMDREEFTLNPTNCTESKVWALVRGTGNSHANLENRFQVGDCAALGFAPRFGMQLLNPGRRSTVRSFNPAMRFVVAPRSGDANLGPTQVVLPSQVILDQSNIRTVCTRDEFAARECPQEAIYGFARAWSPLLDEPLQGPVYLGSSPNPLPDLIADMQGQVRIVLQGQIDGVRPARGRSGTRMRNTFNVVPDVPVSRFSLTMLGGANRGVLVNSRDLCRTNERGVAMFRAANQRRSLQRPAIRTAFNCGELRQRIARRQIAKRRALRQAVRSGDLTPATARRAIRS